MDIRIIKMKINSLIFMDKLFVINRNKSKNKKEDKVYLLKRRISLLLSLSSTRTCITLIKAIITLPVGVRNQLQRFLNT